MKDFRTHSPKPTSSRARWRRTNCATWMPGGGRRITSRSDRTLALLVAGLMFGCFNAWHWVTNLISITDGQVYLSPALFELGVLPAVDVSKSVSRVGGKAQRAASLWGRIPRCAVAGHSQRAFGLHSQVCGRAVSVLVIYAATARVR